MAERSRPRADPELRRRAEQRLAARPRGAPGEGDAARLLSELEVHQVELEMQNEELVAARTAAEASLAGYTELFDFAPIAYFALSAEGVVQQANLAAGLLVGLERARLVGYPLAQFVAPPDLWRYRDFLAHATGAGLEGSGAWTTEVTFAGQRDGERRIRLRAAALATGSTAVLVAGEDVTSLRRAEERIRSELHRRDEFLAVLAHELRNPLAPIRNALQIMGLAEPGSEQDRHARAIVERQVEHVVHLVDDLLDVARIASGKIQLHRRRLDLVGIVRQALDDQRAGFVHVGVELASQLAEGACWVDADPDRLVQVLTNLLVNAQKFTPRGGKVEVEVGPRGEGWLLRVRDNGAGIPAELQRHLFQPFVQAPQELARSRGGLGLGLATVKGLVELHGGRVAVSSAGPGRGAEFTVWLPVLPGVAAERPVGLPPAATSVGPRWRVLVVEDDPDAGDSMREILEMAGYQATLARDGARGLSLALALLPEVIICDLGLPGMDGYEVARALRAEPALRDVYLVALSGYAQPADMDRALAAGFDRHLPKPTSLAAIEQALDEVPRVLAGRKPPGKPPA